MTTETTDPRLKSVALHFRCFADLIDAGVILDAAWVVTPTEGEAYVGFATAPRKPDVLIAELHILAGWVGQTEKNAAIEKAMMDRLASEAAAG